MRFQLLNNALMTLPPQGKWQDGLLLAYIYYKINGMFLRQAVSKPKEDTNFMLQITNLVHELA